MIVTHRPNGRAWVDREALRLQTGLSEIAIRKHLRPVAYDHNTGRALYDHDDASRTLERVKPKPRNRRAA